MKVHLYEKSYHKSNFLEEVSQKLDLNTKVFQKNIFELKNLETGTIMSRAFKPMPIVLDLVLFLDLAKKSNMFGVQEWLSFYFKSPMTRPNVGPEHDIFVQLAKLKNTLRHIMGEELITHLDQD